tara:strand:+ start:132 stop:323 length:192 start_codon:yes stop_codon:yes gene_type:complete
MIKNIRHIQIKKIIDSPNLYKAIIIYEQKYDDWFKNDDIESIKLRELEKMNTKNNVNKEDQNI